MHAWQAIQKSLDFIEDNLSEDITIDRLASTAALSPYYFQRLFSRLVKKPVNEYVKLRRLAKASKALENKAKRIIDVALDCGFSNHANFTRAFIDAYGITPEAYRNHPVALNQFIKPDLLLNYARIDENEPLIADGIIIEVTRRTLAEPRAFIGIAGKVPDTELAGGQITGIATTGEIWSAFHTQKPNILHLLPNGNEIGVLYSGTAQEGCCVYMAGAEATSTMKAEGCSSYTLPCGEYVVCCFEAENFTELVGSAVFKATEFMNGWMRRNGLVCGDFVAELYYPVDPDGNYMELWLPIKPTATFERPQRTKSWEKTDWRQKPTLDTLSAYVNNTLWEQLHDYVGSTYHSKPVLEYSKCSMQPGWNVKYKKAGRTLCTLYPMEGNFITLIVISQNEQAEIELALPFFTPYLQALYHETKTGMGQKWLMIHVTDEAVLEDVKQCIAIRNNIKKKSRRNWA